MFVQHTVASSPIVSQVNNSTADFDLTIVSKSPEGIKGKILFQYLQQSFQASIEISSNVIKIKCQYPLEGISSTSPLLTFDALNAYPYFYNGAITKNGNQQIVWLMLDLIHLYNLLRLKPATFLEIYRETYALIKSQNEHVVFGNIPLEGVVAKTAAASLAHKMKLKHKYVFCNPMHLLANVQHLLSSYPQQFLLPLPLQPKPDYVLS